MRRLGPLIGIAAMSALLVVACGGRPPESAGAPPDVVSAPASTASSAPASTGNTSPAGPHLPAGAVPVAGSKVDASALPAGYPRLVWTQNNGLVIGFYGLQGACTTVSASVVSQTGTAVTVRLVQTQPATTKPCPDYLLNKVMTVNLDQPLGSRSVIMQAAIERG